MASGAGFFAPQRRRRSRLKTQYFLGRAIGQSLDQSLLFDWDVKVMTALRKSPPWRGALVLSAALLSSCATDDASAFGRWNDDEAPMAEPRVEEDHHAHEALEEDEPPPSSQEELSFPEPDPSLLEVEPGSLPTWTEEEVRVQRTKVAAALDDYKTFPYRFDRKTQDSISTLLLQDEDLRTELVDRGLEDIRPLWSEAHMNNLMKSKMMEGALMRPVDGGITSPYGNRFHPIYKEYRLHTGTDFGEPSGEPIAASGSGKVYFAGNGGGYGNLIKVDHGGGLTTWYAHLSRFRVKSGDLVAQGQRIGDVGSTGNSTGPHLHFEVRINGATSDPMKQIGSR